MGRHVIIFLLAGTLFLKFGSSLPSAQSFNKDAASVFETDEDIPQQDGTKEENKLQKEIDGLKRALVPTDLLGWTVFQRRIDGSVNFYRNWNDYVNGFGNSAGEYWMGLEKIGQLMKKGNYELRIDMQDFDGNWKYAYYNHFHVGDKHDNFLLTVSGYLGNAGDGLSHQNNMQFSTKDHDNDVWGKNCAQVFKGGWWYAGCHESNLNGLYHRGAHTTFADGVNWRPFRGYNYSLKYTEMKIRMKP